MAKRYMLQMIEKEYFVYECRGMKRRENKLQIKTQRQYIYEMLYEQFVENIRSISIKNLSYKDIEREQSKVIAQLGNHQMAEKARLSGYLLTDEYFLDLKGIQRVVTDYHREFYSGTYHLYNENNQLLIRRGEHIRDRYLSPIMFPEYESRILDVQKRYEVWKGKMLFHFSEWELLDVLWIATLYQEHKGVTYASWITNKYGDRSDYIKVHNEEKMRDVLYLNLVLNN